MRRPFLLASCLMMLAAPALAGPLRPLAPVETLAPATVPVLVAKASKAFSRCMRERYGPRYYRGVKRAHRYFMAQACGG
jgi:hypothetical protein